MSEEAPKFKEYVPAFPVVCDDLSRNQVFHAGMEIRDFAALKFVAAQIQREGMEGCDKALISAMAYEIADCMMEARVFTAKIQKK